MADKTTHRDFTFPTCPHCGQRMLRRHGAELPPMQALIFDLIEASKTRGVTPDVLASTFFPTKASRQAQRLVAVHINHINDRLISTDICVRMSPPRVGAYKVGKRHA